MKIQTSCPKCKASYSIKESMRNRKLKCKCGEIFQLSSSGTNQNTQQTDNQTPSNFWDERFKEIEEDMPTAAPDVVAVAKQENAHANFESTFMMDPYVGQHLYSAACFMIFCLLLLLPIPFGFGWLHLTLIPIPIFFILALGYRMRAHYVNHMTISVRKEGISIVYIKRLPWPCRNQFIPIDSIEDVRIERNTVAASWLLPRAEFSHTHYGSNGNHRTYVFVYDLKCKIKNKMWESRLATLEDRATAKNMRWHLKQMLHENNIETY